MAGGCDWAVERQCWGLCSVRMAYHNVIRSTDGDDGAHP